MYPATLDQLLAALSVDIRAITVISGKVYRKIYKKFIFTLKLGSSTQGNPLFTTTLRIISKSLD